jgi:hypothetical protein
MRRHQLLPPSPSRLWSSEDRKGNGGSPIRNSFRAVDETGA